MRGERWGGGRKLRLGLRSRGRTSGGCLVGEAIGRRVVCGFDWVLTIEGRDGSFGMRRKVQVSQCCRCCNCVQRCRNIIPMLYQRTSSKTRSFPRKNCVHEVVTSPSRYTSHLSCALIPISITFAIAEPETREHEAEEQHCQAYQA